MNDFDNYAIITICRGQVHLDMTFNLDACAPIQIESYSSDGHTVPRAAFGCLALLGCSLSRGFWHIWDYCNAHTSGGIYLTDNQSPSRVRALIRRACANSGGAHAPSEIATLPDGRYLVRT